MQSGSAPVEFKETKRDGKSYYLLTDPRSKFLFGYITSQGAAFSKMDGAFVFPESMKEDFESICGRLAAQPLLKVEGAARYAHEALVDLKCAYVAVKRFPDNPNSPTTNEYYAPDEQILLQANAAVFEASRATPEQVTKIQQSLAAGILDFDKTKKTPREITDAIETNQLSRSDASNLLSYVEPPTEQLVGKIKVLAGSGQLTDYILRSLVEDGYKLTDEQARYGIEGMLNAIDETLLAQRDGTLDPGSIPFNLRNCYDIEGAARKMATIDERRQVKAFEQADMLRGTNIQYETLTRSQARNYITSGKAFAVSGSRYDEIYDDLNREGWTSAGSNSAYKGGTERNYANGTAQGGAKRSEELFATCSRATRRANGPSAATSPAKSFTRIGTTCSSKTTRITSIRPIATTSRDSMIRATRKTSSTNTWDS
jgi:hypothetical protein